MAQALMTSINLAAAPVRASSCTRQQARPAAAPVAHAARSSFFKGANLRARAPRAPRSYSQLTCRAQACAACRESRQAT